MKHKLNRVYFNKQLRFVDGLIGCYGVSPGGAIFPFWTLESFDLTENFIVFNPGYKIKTTEREVCGRTAIIYDIESKHGFRAMISGCIVAKVDTIEKEVDHPTEPDPNWMMLSFQVPAQSASIWKCNKLLANCEHVFSVTSAAMGTLEIIKKDSESEIVVHSFEVIVKQDYINELAGEILKIKIDGYPDWQWLMHTQPVYSWHLQKFNMKQIKH